MFILTYGVSSLMFAYPTWFSVTPTITEQNLLVDPEVAANPRDLARELMDQQILRGVLGKIRKNDNGYRFEVYRTGTYAEVHYTSKTGNAHIKTRTNDFMGMVKAIHVGTVGVQTGYWLQDLWGWFVALVSAGLILLGATGIYLWFNIHAERVIGTTLLTVGLVWGLTLTVLL